MLNRSVEVYRETRTPDGSGGHAVVWALVSTEAARIAQPSTAERVVALQAGAAWDARVYVRPDADVRRGDRLQGDGETYRVDSTVRPSTASVYLRADCERIQVQGAAP